MVSLPVKGSRPGYAVFRSRSSGGCPMAITTATDPVCGTTVTPDRAAARREFEGKAYYLCSATCTVKFDSHPREYAEAADRESAL
jgi:Cu+-exporting ATPase